MKNIYTNNHDEKKNIHAHTKFTKMLIEILRVSDTNNDSIMSQ